MPLEFYFVLSPKHCIVVIGVNTQRTSSRRDEEEISNGGANEKQVSPQDNKVPLLDEVALGDKVLVVPPPMTS